MNSKSFSSLHTILSHYYLMFNFHSVILYCMLRFNKVMYDCSSVFLDL